MAWADHRYVIARAFLVCRRTRTHSGLKSEPAARQRILGRKLITTGSSLDPDKSPRAPCLGDLQPLKP
jgi:hypothetical protein